MKTLPTLLIFIGLLVGSCNSSKVGQKALDPTSAKANAASNLTEYLAQVPGLMVSGAGSSARFKIRGINSLTLNSDPLFVVNGTPMNQGYASVYDLIDVKDVKSARLLRGSEASFYGARGASGVVLIKLK